VSLLRLGAFALALCCSGICWAETGEELFKDVDSEGEYQDLLSLLDAALKQPVNLLEADTETIATLPWVSPWLARRIVELRKAGGLTSIEDLTAINGVSSDLVQLLSPFVVVEPLEKTARPTGTARLRFISNPPSSSFENAKSYFTARADYLGAALGFTTEKDRMETQINDFQSFYAAKSWPSAYLVAGDFVLSSGYGLVFSRPYGYSPSTVGPWRFSRRFFGLRPYTSTVENFMLEGGALAVETGAFEICIALSRTRLDANIGDSGTVEAIRTSGIHVTVPETKGKDALTEDLGALALRYGRGRMEAGLNLLLSRFDHDFEPAALPWVNGRKNNLLSADMTYLGDAFGLFGEAGLSDAGGSAFIGGAAFERPNIDLLALVRKYSRDYFSLHARPFSAYSRETGGEEGIYMRLTVKPHPRASIAVSSDVHRKDLGLGSALNPKGSEALFDFGIGFGAFKAAVSEKISEREDPPASPGDETEETARYRTRLDLEHKPHRILWLRLRLEGLRSRSEEAGRSEKYSSDLMRLDMRLMALSWFTVKAGFYAFEVEDYSARLYQYEPGLPYYPSLEMLKSDGSRWYLITVLRTGRAGSATIKFGRTSYDAGESREDLRLDYGMRF
jgi:hypothetical protein